MLERQKNVRFNFSNMFTYADIYTPRIHRTTIVIKNHQVRFFFTIFIEPALNALATQMPPPYFQSFHSFIQDHHVAHPPTKEPNQFSSSPKFCRPRIVSFSPLPSSFYFLYDACRGHAQSVFRLLGLPDHT